MTGLDELIRESLHTSAGQQAPPTDLAARAMTQGRAIRRRRRVGLSAAAAVAVVAVVGGSIAIADSVGNGKAVQRVSPAGQPGTPWESWTTDRVYGAKPDTHFINGAIGPNEVVYASGSMSDGTDFVVSYDPNTDHPGVANYTQGWNNEPDFGQEVSEGPTVGRDAQYLTAESPSFQAGQQGVGDSQWLIIVGRPDTVAASFSADGTTWQSMDVQDGIAVLLLPTNVVHDVSPSPGHPTPAKIRLSDSTGEYVDGTLALP